MRSKINIIEKFQFVFWGGAKKRKGFDLIPLIINYLISSGGNYKFFIQRSVYPWMEYHKTLSILEVSRFLKILKIENILLKKSLIAVPILASKFLSFLL